MCPWYTCPLMELTSLATTSHKKTRNAHLNGIIIVKPNTVLSHSKKKCPKQTQANCSFDFNHSRSCTDVFTANFRAGFNKSGAF